MATSGDGTLAVYDVRNGALKQLSDADEDELLSCVIVKRGRKVVAGSQDGVLSIFSWGHFEGCSDRFPGHPDTIDSILKYDEDTVITGGGDGGIRLVSIHPNKLLGVVGYIEDSYHGGGITDMALSSNQRLLVTVSDVAGDVRLWDLKTLQEDDDDDGAPPAVGVGRGLLHGSGHSPWVVANTPNSRVAGSALFCGCCGRRCTACFTEMLCCAWLT